MAAVFSLLNHHHFLGTRIINWIQKKASIVVRPSVISRLAGTRLEERNPYDGRDWWSLRRSWSYFAFCPIWTTFILSFLLITHGLAWMQLVVDDYHQKYSKKIKGRIERVDSRSLGQIGLESSSDRRSIFMRNVDEWSENLPIVFDWWRSSETPSFSAMSKWTKTTILLPKIMSWITRAC